MWTLVSTRLVHNLKKILLLAVLVIQGCGYSFQGDRLVIPQGVNKIFLVVKSDGTPKGKDAEIALKDAVESRFDRTSAVLLVENRVDSDSILEVQVVDYRDANTATTSSTDSGLQKETSMTVSSVLMRSEDNLPIWTGNVSSSKSFGSTGGSVLQGSADFAEGDISSGTLGSLNNNELLQSQESDVLEAISTKIAKDLFLKIFASEF